MSITLTDIDTSEDLARKIRIALASIGRELYKMREGEDLPSGYNFSSYKRKEFSGRHYVGQEGPDWELGTHIFSLCYYRSYAGGGDVAHVTFPQSWLDQDWRALEQARLAEERLRNAELRRIEEERAQAAQEEIERETYDRLKAKFGGDKTG